MGRRLPGCTPIAAGVRRKMGERAGIALARSSQVLPAGTRCRAASLVSVMMVPPFASLRATRNRYVHHLIEPVVEAAGLVAGCGVTGVGTFVREPVKNPRGQGNEVNRRKHQAEPQQRRPQEIHQQQSAGE